MIYLARLIYLTAAALGLGCIFALMALFGRRGTPLIDAPEFIPWAICGLVFAFGLALMAQVMGNDLAPHLPGAKGKAPRAARPAGKQAGNSADAQAILAHYAGEAELSPLELDRTRRRMYTAQEAALTPEERARRDSIAQLQVDTAPVRLQVMVPPQPSDSWVGGNPSMPPDLPWPEVDGKPATFFAQIAAHQLPPDMWGWQGPRSGWLLFFGGDQGYGGGLVLHTTSLGEERPRPYGQVFRYFRYGRYDEQAVQMMGDAGLQPPRWPVKVVPAGDQSARPAKVGAGQAFDPDHAGWQPFDWPTLGIFVEELIAEAKKIMDMSKSAKAPDRAAAEAARFVSLSAMLPSLEQLAELIRQRAETAPFSLAERDRILAPILALEYDTPLYDNGKMIGMGKKHLVERIKNSEYPALHDMRARHVYCSDPAALLAEVRALLEPQWQAIAADEVITMGGSAAKFERDDAVMLELVPSRLFSWTFGDYSNFAIVLPKGHLLDGAFDKAEAIDNHGI